MSIEVVLHIVFGVLLIILGLLTWIKRKIMIFHKSHYKNVKQEDIPIYTRSMGIGQIVIGVGLCLTGILRIVFKSRISWIPLIASIIVGLIIMHKVQMKYNWKRKACIKNIIPILNSSLLFQSFRILVVLTVLMYILSRIIPNQAYINADMAIDNIEKDSLSISNCIIENCDSLVNSINVEKNSSKTQPKRLENDLSFISSNRIGIHAFGSEPLRGFYITVKTVMEPSNEEYEEKVWIGAELSIGITPCHIREPYYICDFEPSVRIRNENDDSPIKCEINHNTYVYDSYDIVSFHEWGLSIAGDNCIHIRDNCNVKIICYGTISIDCDSFEAYPPKKTEFVGSVSIIIPANVDIDIIGLDSICECINVSQLQSKIRHVQDLSLFGDGKVNVLYTADSKEYNAYRQSLFLNSKNSEISLEIMQDISNESSYSISIYGFAEIIDLANISLIPSILNWFKENVYLLPTILVTIVVGSIGMMKINTERKKTDSNNSNT